MRYEQKLIISAGDMSDDVASIGIDTQQLAIGSIQAIWTTSDALGSFEVEVSNDIVQVSSTADPAANVVNWSPYPGLSLSVTGAAGDYMWEIGDVGSRWIRLKYTSTSGEGAVSSTFFGKGP